MAESTNLDCMEIVASDDREFVEAKTEDLTPVQGGNEPPSSPQEALKIAIEEELKDPTFEPSPSHSKQPIQEVKNEVRRKRYYEKKQELFSHGRRCSNEGCERTAKGDNMFCGICLGIQRRAMIRLQSKGQLPVPKKNYKNSTIDRLIKENENLKSQLAQKTQPKVEDVSKIEYMKKLIDENTMMRNMVTKASEEITFLNKKMGQEQALMEKIHSLEHITNEQRDKILKQEEQIRLYSLRESSGDTIRAENVRLQQRILELSAKINSLTTLSNQQRIISTNMLADVFATYQKYRQMPCATPGLAQVSSPPTGPAHTPTPNPAPKK